MIPTSNLSGSYSLIAYPNRLLVVSKQQDVAKLHWYENSEEAGRFLQSVNLPRNVVRKIQTAHARQRVVRIPDIALTQEQLAPFGA